MQIDIITVLPLPAQAVRLWAKAGRVVHRVPVRTPEREWAAALTPDPAVMQPAAPAAALPVGAQAVARDRGSTP